MLWFFIILVLVVLATIITRTLKLNRTSLIQLIGMILVVVLFIVLTDLFWKHALIALIIATISSLNMWIILRKFDPSRATTKAITTFALMFVLSCLALQLTEPAIFIRQRDPFEDLRGSFDIYRIFSHHDVNTTRFLAALGGASLIASLFLDRWMKAVAIFMGTLVVLCLLPSFLERGIDLGNFFYSHDRVSRLALFCVVVIGVIGLAKMLINSKNSQNP